MGSSCVGIPGSVSGGQWSESGGKLSPDAQTFCRQPCFERERDGESSDWCRLCNRTAGLVCHPTGCQKPDHDIKCIPSYPQAHRKQLSLGNLLQLPARVIDPHCKILNLLTCLSVHRDNIALVVRHTVV